MSKANKEKQTESKDAPQDAPKDKESGLEQGGVIQVQETEYQELKKELSEYKDKCVRLYAEFENTRKRYERDKIEFVKYANEGLITEFLGILDDLERSINVATVKHQDYDSFLKGIEMVMAHVYELLKKNNVRQIESVGKKFDPHCHEVLMQEQSDQFEDGVVMEEFQKGYYLGDRVVRTAKVKVAVAGQEKEGDPAGEEIE